jgi:hypothetical protein
MLGGRAGEAGELSLRRSAFRSASFLAGVQAQVQVQTFLFAPTREDPDRFDGVSINGFVELTRVRPDAPVVIGRAMATDPSGCVIKPFKDEPIDAPAPGDDNPVPLLHDFCSSPVPRFRRHAGERGFVENELAEGPVGRTGAATFFSGMVVRSMGHRHRNEESRTMDLLARVRTPVAVLVYDALVHEDIFGAATAASGVYSDLFGDAFKRGPEGRERYRLPTAARAQLLGRGLGAAHTPDVPRYTRMLQHVTERLGWEAGKMLVYRVRIEYPYAPTTVAMSFGLLEPESDGGDGMDGARI